MRVPTSCRSITSASRPVEHRRRRARASRCRASTPARGALRPARAAISIMFSCRSDRKPCCGPKIAPTRTPPALGPIDHVPEPRVDRGRIADETDRPARAAAACRRARQNRGSQASGRLLPDPSGDVRGDERVAVRVAGDIERRRSNQAPTPPGCARHARAARRRCHGQAWTRPPAKIRRAEVTNSLPGVSTSPESVAGTAR